MRKVQKFGAAAVVAAILASGMTTVHASGTTITAAQNTYICAQIEKTEVALSSSSNPFVKKYLTQILAYLQSLEKFVGGCAGS